jgi:hypothetical protein
MKEKINLILLGIFVLFGALLLRGGMSGFTVAENCALEKNCPTTSAATLENPASLSAEDNNALSVVGLLIIVISVSLVFGYLKWKIKQEKEK